VRVRDDRVQERLAIWRETKARLSTGVNRLWATFSSAFTFRAEFQGIARMWSPLTHNTRDSHQGPKEIREAQ